MKSEKFKVEIKNDTCNWEEEFHWLLGVTHNGYQWITIRLTTEEIEQVAKEIQNKLNE